MGFFITQKDVFDNILSDFLFLNKTANNLEHFYARLATLEIVNQVVDATVVVVVVQQGFHWTDKQSLRIV